MKKGASNFTYETGDTRDEISEAGRKKTDHWLFSIKAEKYASILDKYPMFRQKVSVRSQMRRAHLMFIQKQLYESYSEHLIDSGSINDERTQSKKFSFLPV